MSTTPDGLVRLRVVPKARESTRATPPTPHIQDADMTLYLGDALDVLRALPDASADCCVTSPPYWNLRDYGVPGQLGLEPTPEAYVAAMVAVFAEVRRVLSDAGTLWLNLGDSYASSPPGNVAGVGATSGLHGANNASGVYRETLKAGHATKRNTVVAGLKPKDLCGVPWRLAFALQQDGWYLRSDIIWAKPNPMPESVTDRPTKAHEYVFLLSKSPRYFYDATAIAEPASWDRWSSKQTTPKHTENGNDRYAAMGREWTEDELARYREGGRNARSVWNIATQPYPDAHFAVFPEELARRCILAGCPEWVCRVCGKPRERLTVREPSDWAERKANGEPVRHGLTGAASHGAGGFTGKAAETVGWSDCGHGNYRPGTVLDPFAGSGTTGLVARRHGRRSILIELNEDYARMAARRLQQLSLLATEGTA